jgi:hypothetical protein
MLCVTTWGAVLELKTWPWSWCTEYLPKREKITKEFATHLLVADPDAVDAGQYINLADITLVARVKRRYADWPKTPHGDFHCTLHLPMPKLASNAGRWQHDDVHETDADSDNYIEYKCHSCGYVWRTEMPD